MKKTSGKKIEGVIIDDIVRERTEDPKEFGRAYSVVQKRYSPGQIAQLPYKNYDFIAQLTGGDNSCDELD